MNYRSNSSSHHVSFLFAILYVLISLVALPLAAHAATPPGFPISITGSGFTPTDNWVQFTNNSTQEIYEVGPLSSNGTTLSFLVPPNAPTGNYTVKAGAFNSNWSNSKAFTISAPVAPVISLSATPVTLLLGQSTQINWVSAGAINCAGSMMGTTTPYWWTSPELNGSVSFTPDRSTTFTLTCGGQAGTTTKSVPVSVSTQKTSPTVTLTAAPKTISTLGQGTTLAWTTSNATTCAGSGSGLSGWDGTQSLNGSLYVIPNGNTSFILSCTGTGGTASSTISVTAPTTPSLSAICSVVGASTVGSNQLATFIATPTGGTGSYVYSWTGTDGLVGSAQSVSRYYTSSGTKTATTTVTSGGRTVAVGCPTIQANMGVAGPSLATPNNCYITSITPSSGPSGTMVSINTSSSAYCSFTADTSSITLQSGGQTIYIRPTITSPRYFSLVPSLPLPSAPGSVYLVNILTNIAGRGLLGIGVQNNAFTLTGSSISPLSVTTINPFTGQQGSVVTLSGSGFSADTSVLVTQGNSTYAITPSTVTATSLTFAFSVPSSFYGDYLVTANKQGTTSNAVTFTLTPPTNPPPTISLSATPTSFALGATTTLNWITTGASSCQGSGATSTWNKTQSFVGTLSFNPIQTTTYTLTCSGPGGVASKNLTLPVTLTLNTSGWASSYHVGEIVPIKWKSAGIDTVQISLVDKGKYTYPAFAVVPASSGQYKWVIKSSDIPYVGEYYKISLSDPNNPSISSKSSLIEFLPPLPPPTVSISASPTSITAGQSSTLSWSSTNATSCTASGAWDGSSDGTTHSIIITPTITSTYTLTCSGSGGTSMLTSVTLNVANSPNQPIVNSFSSTPPSVTSGQSVTLSWTSMNATYCWGAGRGPSKTFATSGSLLYGPLSTTTAFTITCVNGNVTPNLSAQKTISVPVTPTPISNRSSSNNLASVIWAMVQSIFKK